VKTANALVEATLDKLYADKKYMNQIREEREQAAQEAMEEEQEEEEEGGDEMPT